MIIFPFEILKILINKHFLYTLETFEESKKTLETFEESPFKLAY